MTELLSRLREVMQAAANPAHAASMQRFFKEEVNCLGIPSKAYKALLKPFAAEVKQMPKTKVWQLCEELRKSGVMEEGGAAAEFCMAQQKNFMPDDIEVFEHWIDTFIRDWASCDAFCGHAVGTLIVKYPEAAERTLLWAKSPLPYTRRAAAVSYTGIAKDCGYPDYVFRIADLLLTDKEDIVQKGYGWMLKVASAKHTQEVFAYVCRNKAVMPRTALRYAIEKMPPEMRKIAMEK